MQVYVRFLTISGKLPKDYSSLLLPDGSTVEDLLKTVETNGRNGAFCAPEYWPGLPEHVLLAADARMLRLEEPLYAGQKISIIGQMIGG